MWRNYELLLSMCYPRSISFQLVVRFSVATTESPYQKLHLRFYGSSPKNQESRPPLVLGHTAGTGWRQWHRMVRDDKDGEGSYRDVDMGASPAVVVGCCCCLWWWLGMMRSVKTEHQLETTLNRGTTLNRENPTIQWKYAISRV
eukprot:scaffold37804_cov62-Attheya_sp.AAC.3